ncbi:hypothetical protein FCM35_KLT15692 [Carex littledalei]|uniref:F-box domain-containing protein n=1 Tax=Carex littledalei TaxID=544730 RepID=A0A833RQ89_9POAL|nr:hypothetical protein FCM35_KLT15692 [Carex littledalei]
MASEADQNQPAKKPTLSTDQEEEQQDLDFISRLPDKTLHTILSKLEIRDAAVTTAVSKRCVCFSVVEELSIFDTSSHSCYQIPTPVLFCNTIVKLKIRSCRLVVLLKLIGLRSVKSLILTNISVEDDDPKDDFTVQGNGKVVHYRLFQGQEHCHLCTEFESDIDEESDGSFFGSEGTDDEEIDGGIDDEEIDGGFSVSNSEKTCEETNEPTNLMDILNGLHRLKDLRLYFSNDYRMDGLTNKSISKVLLGRAEEIMPLFPLQLQ